MPNCMGRVDSFFNKFNHPFSPLIQSFDLKVSKDLDKSPPILLNLPIIRYKKLVKNPNIRFDKPKGNEITINKF